MAAEPRRSNEWRVTGGEALMRNSRWGMGNEEENKAREEESRAAEEPACLNYLFL